MPQDPLTNAVVSRLRELDLPVSLLDLDGFRDGFLFNQWVMFVRDGDVIADVHLIQPKPAKTATRQRVSRGRTQRNR